MAFHEVRDGDTGELVIKYDPERDCIEYRTRKGEIKEKSLYHYRASVRERRARAEEARRGR